MPRSPLALILLALLTPLGGTAPLTAATPPRPKGTLVIVGGGERSLEVMHRFVELAGGPGRALVAVVPMASEDAAGSGRDMVAELDSLGARSYVVLLTRAEAETDRAVSLLDSATGVWFTGGDQDRLTGIIGGTAAHRAIQARYRAGAVVGGSSAGASIMSDSMITGNQTPPGDSLGYYGDEYPAIARHRIEIHPGLGFLSAAIVDQHFIIRERVNRLLSAVLEHPALIGVGIDESTAIEVAPDGRWRVLGQSAVLVFDARKSRITPGDRPVLGALDVRLQLLPSGSTYDPATGRATITGL